MAPTADQIDERQLTRIRAVCLAFPEAEEVEFRKGTLFRVRKRRFAIFRSSVRFPRRSLDVATDPTERDALRQDARFRESVHHPHLGWMALDLHDAKPDWPEITELLETAYRQVAARALVEQLDAGAL